MLGWWSMVDAADPQEQANTRTEQNFSEARREASLRSLGALQQQTPPPAPVEQPPVAPIAPLAAAPQPTQAPDELAAIRRQELHYRRQMAEAQSQWEEKQRQAQAELQPKLSKLEQHEARLAAAKDDPIAYLQAAGFTEADFDTLARRVYAASPEAAKDPKTKAAAEAAAYQTRAQREAIAEAKAAREEAAAVRRLLEERDQASEEQARLNAYLGSLAKAAGEAPIVRARLASSPEATNQRLLAIADKMYRDADEWLKPHERVPAPESVLKAYEAEIRADTEANLRALGIDPAILSQSAPAAQVAAPNAPTGPAIVPAQPNGLPRSPTLAPNAGTPTSAPPKGRLSRDQLIKEAERLHAIAKP